VDKPIEISVFRPTLPIGLDIPRQHASRSRERSSLSQHVVVSAVATLINLSMFGFVWVETNFDTLSVHRGSSPSTNADTVDVFIVDSPSAPWTERELKSNAIPLSQAKPEKAVRGLPRLTAALVTRLANASPPVATAISLSPVDQQIESLRRAYQTDVTARIAAFLNQEPSPHAGECTLQVRQATDGTILEVNVGQCVGPAGWGQRLAEMVSAAAPLPSAPREDVFAPELTIKIGKRIDVIL
jgi:hypothetical protein